MENRDLVYRTGNRLSMSPHTSHIVQSFFKTFQTVSSRVVETTAQCQWSKHVISGTFIVATSAQS